MNSILGLVIIFSVFGFVLAVIAFLAYRRTLRRAKGIERGLKMVPLLIHLPPPGEEQDQTMRDSRQILQEKISQAEVLYDLLAGTAQSGFKSSFYGQRHIALEIVASGGLIHFFAAVPVSMVSVAEQAILSAYPGARLEEVEDHNIFNPHGHLTGVAGGELTLKHEAAYPIGTYKQIERDPLEALLNALSKLRQGDGAAVQIMLRPARKNWTKQGLDMVARKRKQKMGSLSFTPGDIARAAYKAPSVQHQEDQIYKPSKLEESVLEAIEDKTRYPGYEVLVRVLTSSPTYDRSQMLLRNITNAFALFESPGLNGFRFIPGRDMQGLVTAFIFRFFPPELTSDVLNSVELATIFHLPDAQYSPTSQLERQASKQVDGPINVSGHGLLMGYNMFRGVKKEIRLSTEDRRRHSYIVGQTGTGKSTLLENLAVQDMLAGNGFAFIDPHGDTAEKLLNMVPKNRAEDVIYFNPADMQRPLGLNLFEFTDPAQKDFLIQESINMLYKLYDPGRTGIIGPRFEHWFRNAALTLMSDPNGSSYIEIPKVFTDATYLKNKFKYVTDPTVIDFWTKEMGQTSDYHKSEMLGWFVSKFGALQSNEMMRNIIGQTKSAFNLREIMDQKKILIVNLSKGQVGELNSQLLGMIFVMKFQAAAMSRASLPEEQRPDFSLYVDEFQNFSTESFATILSEARKYRLNLIVANQFIGQLSEEIRDAVFGNVGTIMSYRVGPEDAEFLVKQFAPIFDVRDLVGLPNYSAVMRLMIGGLPSQPFSITALPPLGIVNPEMGLAVKQLSAAKFGLPRNQVESDIFARLQNQPAPAPAPVQPVSTPAPVAPTAVPPVAHPAPAAVPAAAPVLEPIAKPAALVANPLATQAPPPAIQPTSAPIATPAPIQVETPAKSLDIPIAAPVGTPVSPQVAPTPVAPTPVAQPEIPSAPTPNPVAPTTPTLPAKPDDNQALSLGDLKLAKQPDDADILAYPASKEVGVVKLQEEINELADEIMHHDREDHDRLLAKAEAELTGVYQPEEKVEEAPMIAKEARVKEDGTVVESTASAPTPEPKQGTSASSLANGGESKAENVTRKTQNLLEPPHEELLPAHAGAKPPAITDIKPDESKPKRDKVVKSTPVAVKKVEVVPAPAKPEEPKKTPLEADSTDINELPNKLEKLLQQVESAPKPSELPPASATTSASLQVDQPNLQTGIVEPKSEAEQKDSPAPKIEESLPVDNAPQIISAEKPEVLDETHKSPKLNPGEVYVDESGNVVQG